MTNKSHAHICISCTVPDEGEYQYDYRKYMYQSLRGQQQYKTPILLPEM